MTYWDRYAYRFLLGAVIVLLGGGTLFYHLVEKFSWVDAYYFCVVTLATVGYGDVVPKTDLGKLVATFYIVVGVGVLTSFITVALRRHGQQLRKRLEPDQKDESRGD